MDELHKIIRNISEQAIKESTFIKTMPCIVVDGDDDNAVKVTSVVTGSSYVVPNFSGSKLHQGENVQLFYKGNTALNSNAYIGASLNKDSGNAYTPFIYVTANTYIGQVFENKRIISKIGIRCENQTVGLLVFNGNIVGTEEGSIDITIFIDDKQYPFVSQKSLQKDYYDLISLTLPIDVSSGEHEITIYASGTGNILSILSYVYGNGIEDADTYDPTNESDYVYEIVDDNSNVIYYIGSSKNPSIPVSLNNKPIKELYSVSFNHSDIETVYIPDGIEQIE